MLSTLIWPNFLRLWVLFQALLLCAGRMLPHIYWNSSNPIFRIDNTDHVKTVRILDRVNIMCPYYDPNSLFDTSQVEYSKIYSVSRSSYDRCHLAGDSKLVGSCLTPHREGRISLVFRQFTPLPGGLEFTPGQSYYFISTSNGSLSGLSNGQGGLCLQKNMKLKFEVYSADTKFPVPPPPVETIEVATDPPRWRHQKSKEKAESNSIDEQVSSTSQPTPTPILYVVHTYNPDDDNLNYYNGQQYQVKDSEEDEDDDGSGCNLRVNVYLLSVTLLLASFLRLFNS